MADIQTTTADRAPPRRTKRTRDRVTDGVRKARDTVKTKADEAVRATSETLDANPFSALAGAIAAGAVAAALIPTTRQELTALGPWAEKMREALEDAFAAAKDAGTGELTAAGLSFAAASDGIGGIIGKVVKAATTATTAAAAAASVKQSRTKGNDAGGGGAPHVQTEPPVLVS